MCFLPKKNDFIPKYHDKPIHYLKKQNKNLISLEIKIFLSSYLFLGNLKVKKHLCTLLTKWISLIPIYIILMVEIDINNDFFSLMLEFSDFPPSLLNKKLKNNENKIDIFKKIKKLRDLIFYNSKYIRTTMNIAPKAQKTNHLLFFFSL